MITVNEWASIRILSEKGHSIKKISRLLKMSRNTVRKAIRSQGYKDYSGGEKPVTKSRSEVAKYHDHIIKMLIKDHYIGSRIFNELISIGYKGSKTAFYDYLRRIKGGLNLSKISTRYETGPAKMTQFDWSEYTVILGDTLTKVTVFSAILCYSRYRKYFASLDSKQGSLFESLEEAFHFFGGVTEKILVDNAKTMVRKRSSLGIDWNPKFLEFICYYGIEPKACLPGKPRTKGKVENPFFYLEQHFIKGTKFGSFSDFCNKLDLFNEEVNERIHQGTGSAPKILFEQSEGRCLKPLPKNKFIGATEEFRKVNYDCLISVGSNKYSVPYPYAGKSVWIRVVQGDKLKVFSQQAKLVAVHRMSGLKNQIIIDQTHYEGLRRKKISDKALLMKMFEKSFPERMIFAQKLVAAQRMNGAYHLFKVLDTLKYYPKKSVSKAIDTALELNCFSSNIILGILRADHQLKMEDVLRLDISKDIPQVDIRRDLKEYSRIGGGTDE